MFQSVGFINAQMFWLGQRRYPLVSLQSVVSKNAVQFKGNAQHDAQEFLLWLLDRVHEDLNTVNPNIRPPIKVNYKSGFFFVCMCACMCSFVTCLCAQFLYVM